MKLKLPVAATLLMLIFIASKATAQHTAQLYGMAQKGGASDKGVIFHYTPSDHTFHNDFSFGEVVHGKVPKSDVTDGGNGIVYGTTTLGGDNNAGVIYKWDLNTNTYTEPYSFEAANGTDARGALVLYNGKYYGMANKGGTSDGGVIFEWDPVTNVYTKKIDFDTNKGYNPTGTLMLYGDVFYGVATNGGTANAGTLFTWNPATGVFTKKHDFDIVNGSQPIAKLVEYNSKLYGMANAGGTSGNGIIYEWNPATDTFTKKKDFTGTDGANPNGFLTLYNNKFYGVTTLGGTAAGGVIFEWNPATNAYIKKKDLGSGTYSGTNFQTTKPLGSLTLKDNIFYCITSAAPEGNGVCKGSVFTWNPATNATAEVTANYPVCVPAYTTYVTEVAMPYGNMVLINNKLYGTGSAYGSANAGVVFEFDTATNTHTRSVHFGASNGSFPIGSLTQLGNKLYGMAYSGDYDHHGNIFEWDMATQQLAVKVRFNSAETGWYGGGGLTYINNKFYGKTHYVYNSGSGPILTAGGIFEWDPVTNIYSHKTNGAYGPATFVNQSNSADMYTLGWGITSQRGAVLKYTAGDESVTIMQELNNDGSQGGLETIQDHPAANSLAYYNGRYYGMTVSNGNGFFKGGIFEWDPATNAITLKHTFTDAEGTYPTGSLTLAGNKFYGLTSAGGETGFGSLFEWDPTTNAFNVKIMLGAIDLGNGGSWVYNIIPLGSMTLYNNKLYGLCHGQGQGPVKGSLFEYDIAAQAITDIKSLTGTNGLYPGANPQFTKLTLVIPNEVAVTGPLPQSIASCAGETASLPFELTDADNDVQQFTITSSTPSLLPAENISITHTGNNYVLTYTPLTGQAGVSAVTVTANDGFGGTVSFTIAVTIVTQPGTQVVVSNAALTAQQPGAQYQWTDCATGMAVPGATQQVFIAQATGSYAVTVSLGNCTATSDCYAVTALGNKGFEDNATLVFVNSQTEELEVVTTHIVKEIQVYNALGQQVGMASGVSKISILPFEAGVYFALINTENGLIRKKFIKQ